MGCNAQSFIPLPPYGSPKHVELVERAMTLLRAGHSYRSAGRVLRIHAQTIRRWAKNRGLASQSSGTEGHSTVSVPGTLFEGWLACLQGDRADDAMLSIGVFLGIEDEIPLDLLFAGEKRKQNTRYSIHSVVLHRWYYLLGHARISDVLLEMDTYTPKAEEGRAFANHGHIERWFELFQRGKSDTVQRELAALLGREL